MSVFLECSHLKSVFYLQRDFSSCLEVYTQQTDFLLLFSIRVFEIYYWRKKKGFVYWSVYLIFISIFIASNRKQNFLINNPQHGLKQFPLIIHSRGKTGFQRLKDALNLHPASFVSKSVCCWEGVCHSVLLVIQLKQGL